MFAGEREALVVPSLFDDLHRFFEDLAVDTIKFGRHLIVT